MYKLTLLVMAAGMGSRYGGLKQLDPVGPEGETIIDYSVFDAIKAGFTKIIFIIRKDFEKEFKLKITDKYKSKIEVEFAFQDINDLPEGFRCPKGRDKPWGTGHAILSARKIISEPFVAINGDDFYGFDSFRLIYENYRDGNDNFSMVSFQLKNTLSKFGGVSRGICNLINNNLASVTETHNIQIKRGIYTSDKNISLNGNEPVSMNYWGFTPKLFNYLHKGFINFLKLEGGDLKSEFLIPSVVNELINSGDEEVKVLDTESIWFGVTYKNDKPFVVSQIKKLIEKGVYPKKLF